jgi:chromate transporter
VLVIGLAVWIIPLVAVASLDLGTDVFGQTGRFFSQAALVTFGGAYAVLAYINTAAVFRFDWLAPGQMVTGLGLAESTPGPLIMVVQFVGFLAGYRFHGDLSPAAAGVLAGTVAVWATFAPCFLWIFLGAPYIEKLRGNRRLGSALSTITAAVVGVIASLALFFGVNTLFTETRQVDVLLASIPVPTLSSIDPFALVVAVVSFVGIWRLRWNIAAVVGGAGLAGLAWSLVAG